MLNNIFSKHVTVFNVFADIAVNFIIESFNQASTYFTALNQNHTYTSLIVAQSVSAVCCFACLFVCLCVCLFVCLFVCVVIMLLLPLCYLFLFLFICTYLSSCKLAVCIKFYCSFIFFQKLIYLDMIQCNLFICFVWIFIHLLIHTYSVTYIFLHLVLLIICNMCFLFNILFACMLIMMLLMFHFIYIYFYIYKHLFMCLNVDI